MASTNKVHRGKIWFTDGSIVSVQPENGKKFGYREMQRAVGGLMESLIPGKQLGVSQLYCNEEGLLESLPDNPATWNVVNGAVYKLNGYPASWRVSGNMFGILPVDAANAARVTLPTIAEAMRAQAEKVNARYDSR